MTWYSNAATLEKRLHNQSWSTSYPLWAGDNPGPEIESCSIKKIFISSKYFFFFSSLLLESRMNLLSYEEFYFPECALLHTEFSKEYASWTQCIQLMEFINMICTLIWGFQSYLPVLTTDMKTTYIIPQRCAGWCPWTIVLPCWGESVVHRLMLRCFKTFDVEVSQNESRKLY